MRTPLWDVAREASYGLGLDQEPAYDFAVGAEWGAGWAFAIIGMAQAIRLGRFCEICGLDMQDKVSDEPWLCIHCGRG